MGPGSASVMPSPTVLLSILALMAAPGPTNALLAARGAQASGFRPLLTVAGAYALALTAYALALPWVADVPAVLVALKLACAAWLSVLAVRCWRAAEVRRAGGLFVTTLLNPKAAFLALTLAPSSGVVVLNLIGIGSATLAGALWLVVGAGAGRLGAGPYASKASAIVSAGAAAAIVASVAA
jgi:threonine/homoserine/homoserine lactone efflux protein